MKKVGVIRCQQTEDMCPGTMCFKSAAQSKGAFEPLGQSAIVGFVSCGGCPGKRAVARAKMLKASGAEAVMLASCIRKGTPIDMPCPHFAAMKAAIEKKLEGVPLLDWSH